MAFTSIETLNGVTTIKVTALSDVSGITLERSGDGYIVKYSGDLSTRPNDTLVSSVTKVKVVLGVGTLESIQKEFSLGLNVGEVRVDPNNPLKTEWGSLMKDQFHYAWINGTPGSDNFDFTDTTSPSSVSSATRALMAADKRGIWVDLGSGADTVKGSSFGDNFNISGSGLKKIDGGANEGTTPWGNKAVDAVEVFIKLDPADYDNATVIDTLVSTITVSAVPSTDPEAANGYTHVLKRGTFVLAYLKNVEQINIQLWKDFNNDSRVQWDSDPAKNESKWAKNIQLAVNVGEIRLNPTDDTKTDWGINLSEAYHYAWINGTLGADNIDAYTLVSERTKALMVANKRGLWVDAGADNDTITGSPYADNILGGSGNDKADGGTQIAPTGQKGQDVFEIRLTANDQATAQALLAKIKVLPSDDANYTWMVQRTNDAGVVVETDYLINIEAVSISVNNPTTNQWLAGRWQTIALDVGEVRLKNDSSVYPNQQTDWGTKLTDQMHFAWVNGTASNESFDYSGATSGAATVTEATKALMVQYQRGLWVNMGGGNDTIVGSPYGDNFNVYAAKFNINGLGTRFIDGGQNLGKTPWGNNATDNIDVFVESLAQASLIRVVSLSETPATGSEEATAKTAGYTSKIMSGTTVVAYVKNIEFVNIQVWNDRNGDGQLNWDQDSTKNEMSWVSNIRLAVDVNEIRVKKDSDGKPTDKTDWNTPLADAFHMSWINGTDGADTIVVKSLVSTATQDLQKLYARGLFVDAGAGDDTIVGSDYSDNIVGGAGNDLVDGGKQTAPTGEKGQDVFEVRLVAANATEANAMLARVKVLPSTDKDGYAWKVEQRDANNVVIQTDYLKNIEVVNINISTPNNQWLAGRWQTIALNVGELRLDKTDSTKTEWGSKVADQMHFAWVNGTPSNEAFDYTGSSIPGAATVSAATKTLMEQSKRGLWVDFGGGTDDVVGSPYGDNFNIAGSGVRFIDGGANEGKTPWGNRASDNLDVFVANTATAASILVTALEASPESGTPEAIAKAKGFTGKVMKGDEVLAFIKNIEYVNVQVWNDLNGDGQRQWDPEPSKNEMSWYSNFRLAVDVNEVRVSATDSTKTDWGTKLSDQYHFAWINGTEADETINAKELVSSELLTLQGQYKRGLSIQAGPGKDKITGSDYPDNIEGGTGNDEVDGGTHTAPTGERANDVFQVQLTASTLSEANTLISRVSVLPSDDNKFQWMVVQKDASGKIVETDYLKNIEAVSINVNSPNNQWLAGRWQNTALNVGEVRLDPKDSSKVDNGNKLSDQMHFAWINGTAAEETFDYTGTISGAETISAATKALMVQNKRGLWVDMLGGSDTAVGSPYGDNFNILGSDTGPDYIDGGSNSGTTPWGGNAQDVVEVFVSTDNEAASVQVIKLAASLTQVVTPDSTAYGLGYTQKIVMGNKTLAYIKNIERLSVQKWVDTNGNGQRDWQTEVTPKSSSDLVPSIGYQNNGDATKNPVWVNGTIGSDTINVGDLLKTLPTSSDPKLNWADTTLEINVNAGQGGSDTIIGSANSDMITVTTDRSEVTYVDGGGNTGRQTWANYNSNNPYDSIQLIFDSELAARSVEISPVQAGTDDDAISKGYLFKMKTYSGSVTYIKNVEQVGVKIWTDLNGNGKNDWGNEIANLSFPMLETAQVSWVSGAKGSGSAPPSNFYISGSALTPNINASALIDEFISYRKLNPISSTDLPSDFQLSSIANSSASFGAWVMAGQGDHTISGTNFTDYFIIDPRGNNLLDGGTDIGYWTYNGNLNVAQDRIRITEEVQLEAAYLEQSFVKLATGTAPAFSAGLSPAVSGDDVTGSYQIKATDKVFIALLPKAGKVSFNASKSELSALWKAMQDADNPAKFKTALDNASLVADLKYYVFAGYVDINNDGNREFMSLASLSAPVFTSNEVQFTPASTADKSLSTLISSSRFNSDRHHLIKLTDNSEWIGGGTATSADTAAIDAFASTANVSKANYQFALVTYDDFQKVTGVQLVKNIEALEFRLWMDANQDGRQQGQEVSSNQQSYTLIADSAIHNTADLGMSNVAGKQYAGSYIGTSKAETINVNTSMQADIGAAEVARKLGIRVADLNGNDTVTGTDYDDLFWLGDGTDTINGGTGNDRIAFNWKPAASAKLSASRTGDVITISQTLDASPNTVTALAEITLTSSGGTIKQLNNTLTNSYGTNPSFAMTAEDTFSNIEELVILLDASLKKSDGTYLYNTGGVTELNAFTLKIKPTVDYSLGADATKSTITFNGTGYADVIDAAALIQTLPTSSTPRDNWRGSTLHTNILLNGGGDKLTGTNNADLIDPGTGVNYIDGGNNVGRTAWVPTWADAAYTYWGGESPADQVRFYVKSAAEANGLNLTRLSAANTGDDKAAFDLGYTVKATYTFTENSTEKVSTNYLKNVEYVVLRLWNDVNNNGIREGAELSTYSSHALETPVVNWRFMNLNDPSNGPFYLQLTAGPLVGLIDAQPAIDAFIANKKTYPVVSADKTTLDLPADFQLSNVLNYSNARGTYIMAGTGDHHIIGTNFSDTAVVGNSGYNWIDGGSDAGYVKYDTSASTGSIRLARDTYRVAQTVANENAVKLTNNVLSSNYKIVRLSDFVDLLSSNTVSSELQTAIATATSNLKTKFNIGDSVTAEFAVVKYDLINTSNIVGIDLLRNIELFDVRNWFDIDGNGRPTGSEVGSTSPLSHLLKSDGALIETADQTYETIAGKNYGGYAAGTSLGETANIQTVLEGLLQTYPTKSNNGKGLIITDQGGDDTFTGTQFDDLFITSGGNDSLIGGEGTQDRVGLYWKPSSTAGTPTLQVEKSTVNKTITVSQKIGTATATELVKFTLVNTGADQTNPYWLAEHKNTGLALGWSDSSSGTDKLYGIEQAVFTVHSSLLNADGTPKISLVGLTNNAMVIDLTLS